MPQHTSLTLSAVLLSATVISSPSQASILPPTLSEHRDLSAPAQDTGNRWLHRLGGEQRDLLSTISLAVTDGVKLPQLEHRDFSAPAQDTGNRWLHRLGGEHRDLSAPISLAQIDGRGASPLKRRPFAVTDGGKVPQLASVCFITDAGDCGSLDWEGEGELDNAEKCRNEGYVDTPCGAGLIPIGTCPYDSNWHSKCGCPSDYDKTCTGADEQGKGDACEGKYQECCNLCTGYDYTEDNIPSGYVKTDSCESCNGTKYKARCDISEGGYMDCGEVVGVGGSCTDDSGTYYKQCNCPLNYEWNDETKTCTCSTSFKYDCQGSGYADTQTGNTCDNKYSSCDCAEGFVWDGESGMCVCDGVDWCALNQDCTALGYAQQTCPKWSIKCPYDTSFVKCIDCPPSFSEECKGTGQIGEGQSCEGKYQSCTCDSSYQYTCTGTGYSGGSGTACGDKYTACTCTSPYTWSNGACSCPSTYKYTCTGTGYSGGSGTACGGKYTKCTCKSGYTWKNGTCQKQYPGCTIGALFYSDNTCSSSLSSSKTLLGVVIYEKTSTQNGWVMTVNPIDSNVMWNRLVDTSFTGVTETAANTSCTNTQNLIRLSSTLYDAAKIANDYKLGDKKWCLPSYDVLNNITNSTNFDKIDSGIDAAGGTLIGLGENTVEYIWSSSEYNGNQAWALTKWYRGEPKMEVRPKNNPAMNYTVRPVFSF